MLDTLQFIVVAGLIIYALYIRFNVLTFANQPPRKKYSNNPILNIYAIIKYEWIGIKRN